ncbi:uncharacterized protein LOC135412298 isoform X2 [Pseudopipra pipra]|uniref:uncharacterized protein LOC135412298 isoform X2 n=1 Tax=Pseudopipra pipra TaxID=415032 RepID=UPI003138E2D3
MAGRPLPPPRTTRPSMHRSARAACRERRGGGAGSGACPGGSARRQLGLQRGPASAEGAAPAAPERREKLRPKEFRLRLQGLLCQGEKCWLKYFGSLTLLLQNLQLKRNIFFL